MGTKPLQHYLSYKYDLVIREADDGEVKQFIIYTRELDKNIFYGVGDTIAEAIDSFNEVKADLFQDYLEQGLAIPAPQEDLDELPSGKFVVRIPPQMHMKLTKLAEQQRQSLNSYVSYILTQACTGHDVGLSLLRIDPRTNIVPMSAWRKEGMFGEVTEEPGTEYKTGKAV